MERSTVGRIRIDVPRRYENPRPRCKHNAAELRGSAWRANVSGRQILFLSGTRVTLQVSATLKLLVPSSKNPVSGSHVGLTGAGDRSSVALRPPLDLRRPRP